MSDRSDGLIAGATALPQIFVGDCTLAETLRRVADLANETISGSDMVSVTLLVGGRPRTVAFTDVTAPEIDVAQYHAGIGPVLDALRCQQVQRVDSTDEDERWPPFAEAAAVYGVLSSLALPLVRRHESIGALNCYSRRRAAFSADDEHIGSGFAAGAAMAVADAQATWGARRLEDLSLALQSRATIEQAKGILIAEQHCDADQAFELLARASQRENRKLRDIADRIVKDCSPAIEPVVVHPPAWLTELTDPAGPKRPRGVQVGLPARRTTPHGPLRTG